jgi:exopolysaccharide biosynthesis protein
MEMHPRRSFQRIVVLACTLAVSTQARADWTPSERKPLPAPPGLEFYALSAINGAEKVTLHVVRFNPKAHTFAVMDDPASVFDLASAAVKRGAHAAVNGGYFHPDRTPLGLVVRAGAVLHPIQRARLLSGLVVVIGGRPALMRIGEFKFTPAVREALQAGPFLVDRGRPVSGLNATRLAARTLVFTDDAGQFGLAICLSASLAETARILSTPGIVPNAKITRALNLDGGSSTGLWVRGVPPFYLPEAKDVRNFLAIVPR